MNEYYIPDYVHFALEGDTAIFLNLRTDQYSMLVGEQARAFSDLVSRTADSIQRVIRLERSSQGDQSNTFQDALLRDLLSNGVLTQNSSTSSDLVPSILPLPQEALVDRQMHRQEKICAKVFWTFLVSCVVAKLRLSFASIEHTVRAVRRRKHLRGISKPFEVNEARRLVCLYNRLRPVMPHDYLCLFDSLSLLEFLARHDCYPNWVFAVQLEPWGAHCWVQYGTTVFNEDLDLARTYLPVMSV